MRRTSWVKHISLLFQKLARRFTTLTGVATIKPDFQTIEQDVTGINFSYTEKLLTDRRPFFAEGSEFFHVGTMPTTKTFFAPACLSVAR